MKTVVFRGPGGRAQITREGSWLSVWHLPRTAAPNAPFRQLGQNLGPANTLDDAVAKASDAIDRVIADDEIPQAFR